MTVTLPAPKQKPSFGELFASGFNPSFAQTMQAETQQRQQLEQEQRKIDLRRRLIQDIETGGDEPSFGQQITKDQQKSIIDDLQSQLGFELTPEQAAHVEDVMTGKASPTSKPKPRDRFAKAKKYAAAGEHELARVATAEAERDFKREKFEHEKNIGEREFHTKYSKPAVEKANEIRATLPMKAESLNLARNSIESQDISYFSPDKLADVTGIDLFRTAKGAQLALAGKENLLNNMARVGAKAQNIWFEQRLNSMFPLIGQSKEANLTVMEGLESEELLNEAYLAEFSRLQKEDNEKYGYERKDIEERTYANIAPLEKAIFKRSAYRMKELQEDEKGLSELRKDVGKNVIKGTPLTYSMMKLYSEKYGDKALDVAKKNGYQIPTYEEFTDYRTPIQEFRELVR